MNGEERIRISNTRHNKDSLKSRNDTPEGTIAEARKGYTVISHPNDTMFSLQQARSGKRSKTSKHHMNTL